MAKLSTSVIIFFTTFEEPTAKKCLSSRAMNTSDYDYINNAAKSDKNQVRRRERNNIIWKLPVIESSCYFSTLSESLLRATAAQCSGGLLCLERPLSEKCHYSKSLLCLSLGSLISHCFSIYRLRPVSRLQLNA